MPQFVVRYKNQMVYPGLAMPGATIRGYDSRFINASPFNFPFGRLAAYGSRRRSDGALIPIIPETKDLLVFRDAGISVMPGTYYAFSDELYIEDSNGYKPSEQLMILEKGDIWLPLWQDVYKFQPVTIKNKVSASNAQEAKKDIKNIGYFSSFVGAGNKELKGY
ncbi:MAG: hypothetical protein AAFX80_14855 [Cyanobacteria bacterium J06639_18]